MVNIPLPFVPTFMVATLFSVIILLVVIELIRRNRLKERYSLLWLFLSLVMFCFSISRDFLHYMSFLLGIKYPPSLIFLLAFLSLIIINIHFSTVISHLSEKNKTLAQELALLKQSLEKKEDSET